MRRWQRAGWVIWVATLCLILLGLWVQGAAGNKLAAAEQKFADKNVPPGEGASEVAKGEGQQVAEQKAESHKNEVESAGSGAASDGLKEADEKPKANPNAAQEVRGNPMSEKIKEAIKKEKPAGAQTEQAPKGKKETEAVESSVGAKKEVGKAKAKGEKIFGKRPLKERLGLSKKRDDDSDDDSDDEDGKIRKIPTGKAKAVVDSADDSDSDSSDDDVVLNKDEPLEAERAYFHSIDDNRDGSIDAKEFKKHFMANADAVLDSDEIMKNYGKGKNLTLGMTVGSLWRDLHGDDSHNEAFAGIDMDSDDKISWDEWITEMFHDQPQQPTYVDGEMADTIDGDVFLKFDKDKDGYLDINEIRPFVGQYLRREEVDSGYTGTEPEGKKGTGGIGLSYVFLLDFDADQNNKLSLDEFKSGFGLEEEEEESIQQESDLAKL